MTKRDAIRFAVLIVAVICAALLTGCNGTPDIPRAEVALTTIADTTPRERDLLADLDLTGASLETILETQIRLDRERSAAAALAADRQAEIRRKEAELQRAINEAAIAQQAEIALAAQRARTMQHIAWGLGVIGGLGIVGGALAFFFVGRRMAIAAMVTGAIALGCAMSVKFIDDVLAEVVGPTAKTLSWLIPAALIGGLAIGLGMLAQKLWLRWQTDRHAAHLRADANELRVVNPSANAEDAALKMEAQASLLDHVGTVDYDPKKTFTPTAVPA